MMRETQIYNLSFERTLPYFLNHISCGKYLSEVICKEMDFTKGRFFTVLPIEIDLEKLYQFEHGGIILSNDSNKYNAITTMDDSCSLYIHDYLNKNKYNVVAVENYMIEPESHFVHINNVQMSSFNSEVYYILYDRNSKEEIYKTIRKSSLVWHFLAIMSYMETVITEKLTQLFFHDICANTRFVIAGAYDGEGYIFWERTE
jgi:hypothetical protein